MAQQLLAGRDENASAAERIGVGAGCVVCGAALAGVPLMPAEPPGRPFAVHACGGCGLVQQCPRHDAVQLARLYDSDYYVFAEDESKRWARAVQQYLIHVGPLEPAEGRRLLDVGAALGHFAALATARGWGATALDVSVPAMERARSAFGLEAIVGELAERASEWRGRYDVVFLGDVLEHVADPVGFLRAARRVLAPGGAVCVDTPNWGGAWRRRGGRNWLGLNRFHINLFDRRSLGVVLAAAGLDPFWIATDTHYSYECWADRPEPAAWLRRLPGGLRWRAMRALRGMPMRRRWVELRDEPPTDLAEALAMVERMRSSGAKTAGTRDGDNLIARGMDGAAS